MSSNPIAINYLLSMMKSLGQTDWLAIGISMGALTLSIINAIMTWGKPFTLEFYPLLEARINMPDQFQELSFQAVMFNSGNKAGLITELALVQLQKNKIVEKYPLVGLREIPSKESSNPQRSVPYSTDKYVFTGLVLEPHKTTSLLLSFRIVLQGKSTSKMEKWYIAYHLSTDDFLRLADVEISAAIKDEVSDQQILSGFHPHLHPSHKKNMRKKLVDMLQHVGVGLG